MSHKVCRILADGKVEWRQFGTGEEAAARVAQWWADPSTKAATVVTPEGRDDARYERPGFDEAKAPAEWPRAARRVRPAPAATPAEPDVPLVPMFDDGKPPEVDTAARLQDGPGPPGACRCCLQSAGAILEASGGHDRTPSGRLADRRCPACGAPWPNSARASEILRRYIGSMGSPSNKVLATGRVVHARLFGWPR